MKNQTHAHFEVDRDDRLAAGTVTLVLDQHPET
jgi:hypothetical protein